MRPLSLQSTAKKNKTTATLLRGNEQQKHQSNKPNTLSSGNLMLPLDNVYGSFSMRSSINNPVTAKNNSMTFSKI